MTRAKSPVIGKQLKASEERHVRDLERRLSEAESTIEALLSGQIDAVVDATNGTPVLLAKAQEALKQSEERFRFVLEAAGVGIWDLDFRTGVLQWSEILEAQHGLKPGAFGGTLEAFIERVHPDDRDALRTVMKAHQTGENFSIQHRTLWPDGTVRWLSGAGRIEVGPQGEPLRGVGISLDVTERRRLEAQYLQAQKMEAVGRLASGVAHDFNNLLTVILGFTELMTSEVDSASQHANDLGEIIKAARRAAGLTTQLLAFSRQQVLHATPLDVNGLITDMMGMLARLIGEHVHVALSLSPELSPALVDRGQLEQVVMNLVVNARDAMPGGGNISIATADVMLEESSFPETEIAPGWYVMLAVTDAGSGMTKETQRRLFEPFFTTKESGKGTGLGLSTTYGIVKQSKGYIWVSSEVGQGTTFQVYLPRATDHIPAPALSPAVTAPVKRDSETVLLVEDEVGVRLLSKRVLVNAGYRVLEAENGDDAERLFGHLAGSINLLVTDVMMPGCGGPELHRRLKLHAPALRVLYMSGYTEQSAGGNGGIDPELPFVQKPFTAAEFVRQVRDALDR